MDRGDKENDLGLTNGPTASIVHAGDKCLSPLGFSPSPSHAGVCDTTSSALTVPSMDVIAGGPDTVAAAAATDLIALVDAVDELRVRGCPRETDGGGVDRLGLHVTRGDGGH